MLERFTGGILETLMDGKLVGIQVMLGRREEVDIGLANLLAEITEFGCFVL